MDFAVVTEGIFGEALIRSLIQSGHIFGAFSNTITPISLGLTITEEVYRIPGRIVPQKGERVRHLFKKVNAVRVPETSILERNCSYLVRLRETLVLPASVSANFDAQHSSLASCAHLELICDGSEHANTAPRGYVGELWVHITPLLGPLSLSEETSPGNLFFSSSYSPLSLGDTLLLHHSAPLFFDTDGNSILPLMHDGSTISLTMNTKKSIAEGSCIRGYAFGEHAERQSLSEYVPETILLSPETSALVFTEERIKLPAHLAGCISRNGNVLTYLEPGFGSTSQTGEHVMIPLQIQAHELWQTGQPLCTLEIIPVSQQKETISPLYTPAPEENGETG